MWEVRTGADAHRIGHPMYEDAMGLLLRWLRSPDHGDYSRYGYGVYFPSLVRTYLQKEKGISSDFEVEPRLREIMPVLYACAWELCRRGILRPGIRSGWWPGDRRRQCGEWLFDSLLLAKVGFKKKAKTISSRPNQKDSAGCYHHTKTGLGPPSISVRRSYPLLRRSRVFSLLCYVRSCC